MMEINLGDTELQKNVLKFGYGINYIYEVTLSHSFDRIYVVTKFELPKVNLQIYKNNVQIYHMILDVSI